MNTPRIGDTVHYAPQLTHYGTCQAAITTNTNPDGTICLHVLDPRGGSTWVDGVHRDQAPIIEVRNPIGAVVVREGEYTPGTWHHIH